MAAKAGAYGRKVHLAVDADSHNTISTVVSLDCVHDSEVLPTIVDDDHYYRTAVQTNWSKEKRTSRYHQR